jgi:hypothetical protein
MARPAALVLSTKRSFFEYSRRLAKTMSSILFVRDPHHRRKNRAAGLIAILVATVIASAQLSRR